MNQNIRGQQDMGTGSVPALLAKLAVPAVVASAVTGDMFFRRFNGILDEAEIPQIL